MIKTDIITVTPLLASQWLSNRVRNRPLSQPIVNRYADLMIKGRWLMTHQGIAFDDSSPPRLVDGQHRVAAVVKAGMSITMLVSHGITFESTLEAVDAGDRRTAGHRVSMELPDLKSAIQASAIGRSVFVLESEAVEYSEHVPHGEIVQTIHKYRTEIESISKATLMSRRLPAWMSAAIILTKKTGPDFIDGVCSGVGLEAGDPRLAFRNWFVSVKTFQKLNFLLPNVIASIDAFSHGEKITRLMSTSRNRYQRWANDNDLPVNRSVHTLMSKKGK